MYAMDMYYYLTKISSETKIFIFVYLSSGHSTCTSARIWETVVIFSKQKGVCEQNSLGNT